MDANLNKAYVFDPQLKQPLAPAGQLSRSASELVQTTKPFAVHIDEHMRWNEHITKTLVSCSRDLKHLAPYHVSKQLAESVVDRKCPNLSVWLCL